MFDKIKDGDVITLKLASGYVTTLKFGTTGRNLKIRTDMVNGMV